MSLMKRLALFVLFSSGVAHANCRVEVVTPCSGCRSYTQTICDYSPPEHSEVKLRNGVDDFMQGAAQFNAGVKAWSNSQR